MDLIDDVDRQLASNRAFMLRWDQCGAEDSPSGLVAYRSGISYLPLNGVLRFRGSNLDIAIREARRKLGGVPWAWWVGPDSDAGTAQGLLDRGATELERLPVMAVDLARVAPAAAPEGVVIKHVRHPDDIAEFARAHACAPGMTPDA
jgi:hypothetical protein